MDDNSAAPVEGATPTEAPALAPASWRSALPDDLRDHPSIQDFPDPTALAKSYINTKKLVGADKNTVLRIPSDDDSEGWNDVFQKLGRPEAPEGYQLPATPEGLVDDASAGWFRKAAHEAGLSPKQAAKLYAGYAEFAAPLVEQMQAQQASQIEQGLHALKQEWGAAYDQNLQAAQAVLRQHGDETTVKFLEESRLGDHPGLIKLLAGVAQSLGEDTVTDKSQTGGGVLTPAVAQAQIAEYMANKDWMKGYMSKGDPSHAHRVQEMQRLHRLAAGQRA